MRTTVSLSTLLFANTFLYIGMCRNETNLILVGIGFAVLYLAIEFRHFYEDMLSGKISFATDDKTDD